MIVGVGIDIVSIEKMKKVIEKWGGFFLDKIFNKEELEKIPQGKLYYQKLAARFSAKEAIIKATSNFCFLTMRDIVILNKKNGAPFCKIKKNIDLDIIISLTHIPEYAVATAVVQKEA